MGLAVRDGLQRKQCDPSGTTVQLGLSACVQADIGHRWRGGFEGAFPPLPFS